MKWEAKVKEEVRLLFVCYSCCEDGRSDLFTDVMSQHELLHTFLPKDAKLQQKWIQFI